MLFPILVVGEEVLLSMTVGDTVAPVPVLGKRVKILSTVGLAVAAIACVGEFVNAPGEPLPGNETVVKKVGTDVIEAAGGVDGKEATDGDDVGSGETTTLDGLAVGIVSANGAVVGKIVVSTGIGSPAVGARLTVGATGGIVASVG